MKEAQVKILINALIELAEFEDVHANNHLARYSSYSMFDEPVAVKAARKALSEAKIMHTNGEKYD